jgi:hypothetical protein
MEIIYKCISPKGGQCLEFDAESAFQRRKEGWTVIPTTYDQMQWNTTPLRDRPLRNDAFLHPRAESHLLRSLKYSAEYSLEERMEQRTQALRANFRARGCLPPDLPAPAGGQGRRASYLLL